MRYRPLHTIAAIAWCFAMAIPRAEAQLAPLVELQPGTRVRVQASGIVAGPLEATVVARARDTVTLTTSSGTTIPIPLAAITAAEVGRGRSRGDGAVKGLAWGTGIGLAIGILGAIGYDAASDPCGAEPCDNAFTPSEVVAASFITGAALGAGIGAIVGAEHWERLTIPARIVVRRRSEGLTLALAIPF